MHTNSPPIRLATLFRGPSYSGNYFAVEGIYNSCYNILLNANVEKIESINLEGDTEWCEVWGVVECGEESDGTFSSLFTLWFSQYWEEGKP